MRLRGMSFKDRNPSLHSGESSPNDLDRTVQLSIQLGDEQLIELLQQARELQPVAVSKIIDEYRNYLLLVANSEMNPALQAKIGASDMVQQSLLAIHQNLPKFRGQSVQEFKGWIRQILLNDIRNAHRHYAGTQQRQIDREIRMNDSQQLRPSLQDHNRTPQSEAMLNELALELEICLAQLSKSHQQVLRMRNWKELSFREIGDVLDCTPEAARKLWFRAFKRLRQTVLKRRPEFASHMGISRQFGDDEEVV